MNLNRLYEILDETTMQLRKGEAVVIKPGKFIEVTEIYAMPHEKDVGPEFEKVDFELLVVGVNKEKAEKHREELIGILNEYPEPERLANGPSYIEVGAVIGDQGAAFCLFALGKALGLWKIITPAVLGFTGEEGKELAGRGLIMMSGYKKA